MKKEKEEETFVKKINHEGVSSKLHCIVELDPKFMRSNCCCVSQY